MLDMLRSSERIFPKVWLALSVVLVCIRLAPYLVQNYNFVVTLRPLYRAAFDGQPHLADRCAAWTIEPGQSLTIEQRLVVGTLARARGCLDLASQTLPEFDAHSNRSDLVAYQWGLIAWEQGDIARAAMMWRAVPGIDQWLLARARQLRGSDLEDSLRWYEAAIMSSNSLPAQANAIATYTAEARGYMTPAAFRERLENLVTFFGDDTATGYRLRGQCSLMVGDARIAVQELTRAIALGNQDAETWYWLGEAYWHLNDWTATENAYREALAAPVQIPWRRPWHLDRLAALLAQTGRLDEALPFQEEAVRLDNDYYYYADNLAVLYAQLGDAERAQALCRQARQNVGTSQQIVLRCEQP